MKAVRIKIIGKVQGVFFRSETKQRAEELGLTGWVKNCDDGCVEIYAQGAKEKLLNLKKWCHSGPSGAEVQEVKSIEKEAEECDGFEIR